MKYITLAGILTVFWLISSGIFNTFLLICGFLSVIFTLLFYEFIFKVSAQDLKIDFQTYEIMPNILIVVRSISKLVLDIVLSSVNLIKNIIFGKKIQHSTLLLKVNQKKNNLEIMSIAHSITTTPGSITIFQNNRNLYVHCLYKNITDDITKICME